MTQPCECRNCDNCPCPTSLPVVLREWSGNRDFTGDRDVTQMPGWSRALEHNRNSDAAGYLWRVRAWSDGYTEGEAIYGQVIRYGAVRDWTLYCEWTNRIAPGQPYGKSSLGYFGPTNGGTHEPAWYWTGRTGLRYTLELGVTRCSCGKGLYVNWPAESVERPDGELLIVATNGAAKTSRLELPPSTRGGIVFLGQFDFDVAGVSTGIPQVPWNATAAQVKTAVEAINFVGTPAFAGVSVSGGPLPLNAIEVTYTPVLPLGGDRLWANFNWLLLPLDGRECRRMTVIEEDTRAWCGGAEAETVPHACKVDLLTDHFRSTWASSVDRIGYVESSAAQNESAVHRRIAGKSDLSRVDVVALHHEALAINDTSAGAVTFEASTFLQPLADWLATGGKCLVLDGAVVMDVVADAVGGTGPNADQNDPEKTYFGTAAAGWNRVLTALGCSTRMTGVGRRNNYSISVEDTVLESGRATSYWLEPVASSHPLAGIITATNWEAPKAWNADWLDRLGKIVPGGDCTTLAEFSEVRSIGAPGPGTGHRIRTLERLPAIVVEKLPSGSWVILTAYMRWIIGYGVDPTYEHTDSILQHVPNEFLTAIVERLPYS